jgi:hypothetical protein
MRRIVIALGVSLLTGSQAFSQDAPIVLPKYEVSAEVIAHMIPRDQLAQIRRQAARFTTFRFDEVTMEKAPTSIFPRPIRCLVRDDNGTVIGDLTNPQLTVTIDPTWRDGFLSTNQPSQYTRFYVLLRARLDEPRLSLGFCRELLAEYTRFSEERMEAANRYYAGGRAIGADLVFFTVPDEIAVVFVSRTAAENVGRTLGAKWEDRTVRIGSKLLERSIESRGAGWAVADAAEIECVTPWAALAPLPRMEQHAALFRVGWAEFRKPLPEARDHTLVAVAIWFPD